MPCRSDGYEEAANRETRAELDKVTRMLCALCKDLAKSSAGRSFIDACESGELTAWYARHSASDRVRLRRQAYAKLTKEEIEALESDDL